MWREVKDPKGKMLKFLEYCDRAASNPVTPQRSPGSRDVAFVCPVHRETMLGPLSVKNGSNTGRKYYKCGRHGPSDFRGWFWADGDGMAFSQPRLHGGRSTPKDPMGASWTLVLAAALTITGNRRSCLAARAHGGGPSGPRTTTRTAR